jgi:hypothetical protein
MSANEALRYVEEVGFGGATGVTTTAKRRAEPVAPSYERFWREYYSCLNRKLDMEIRPLLDAFTRLPIGWDSYSAPPLRTDVPAYAMAALSTIMKPQTPLPQVVPTSVGGVQLEWHENKIDLELHITAPHKCEVWFRDNRDPSAEPKSFDLTNNFSVLNEPIDLLTAR